MNERMHKGLATIIQLLQCLLHDGFLLSLLSNPEDGYGVFLVKVF
jgi:hypothetical protein